ncbi:MAG: glycoside hydrolase family 65 protein [Lachnospiraceae bacterium]|nr:glycoside hydrolase family 65 protein [Lachnospiraceae bacterium]
MIDWKVSESGFDSSKNTSNGNKYLLGNGYMGVRGTLDEFEKDGYVAINLAGIYDQVGDAWREPLNAPNALYTYAVVDGVKLDANAFAPKSHTFTLDYRKALLTRESVWDVNGVTVTVKAERFASMPSPHLLGSRFVLTVDREAKVKLVAGIDSDVWDINGPHYDKVVGSTLDNSIKVVTTTHESADHVCVAEEIRTNFKAEAGSFEEPLKTLKTYEFTAEPGVEYVLDKLAAVYTSKDTDEFEAEAQKLAYDKAQAGYEAARQENIDMWESKWKVSEIIIEGDDKAMEATNYSLYHLHCIAPRHADSMSIAARGLSGQTYKGAVFWDTEMFMLDFFLFTEPAVAKTLMKYRIDTLQGAKNKAAGYGFDGAFYAWESQEGGFDGCSDYNVTDVFTGRPMRTFFKDKQIHISAAVVYGIMKYVRYTGDTSILNEGGAETVIECAKFYYSLLLKKVNSDKYELHDVIGPDEYHERVNNNGYTNRMAKYTFDAAAEIAAGKCDLDAAVVEKLGKQYDLADLAAKFADAAEHLYIPQPDPKTGVIEQFDGYLKLEDCSVDEVRSRLLHDKEYWGGAYGVAAHTQVIKQADVVTWLTLFADEFDDDTLLKNWSFYEPRTEHGSSLSACMYALLACRCGLSDWAYPFFMKSASADIKGGGKEWAGLVYIGGTHPAAAGGAYMNVVKGFGGFSIKNGEVCVEPALPSNWTRLAYNINYGGKLYHIDIKDGKADITVS